MKTILFIFFFLGFTSISAQVNKCEVVEPLYIHEKVQNEENLIEFRDEIIIPLVFHIINKEEINLKITETDIYQQIDELNRAFSAENINYSQLLEEFRGLVGDSNIRFCLGFRIINSKIEKGIEFLETTDDYFADQLLEIDNRRRKIKYSSQGGLDGWNSKQYVNVWIGEMSRALGHSTFPYEDTVSEFSDEAGIIIDYSTLPNGKAQGKVLVHELGHYLGLKHIWGSNDFNCTTDDGIADTPIQYEPYYGCPVGVQYSCGSNDMYMNYMDYTEDVCSILFTKGQVIKMKNTLLKYRPLLLNSNSLCFNREIIKNPLNGIFIEINTGRGVSIFRENENLDKVIFMIFDINGRNVYKGYLNKGQYAKDFNIFPFSSGMYFLTLESGEFLITKKFIVL